MKGLFALIVLIVASCDNVKKHETNSDNASDSTLPSLREGNISSITNVQVIAGCYMRVLKRDTVLLNLQQNGANVSGTMNFDNYEKDSSTGEVKGSIENNVVKLWYDFESEGMHSVMELYFKIADSSLIQGIGSMANKADTAYFTDRSEITYFNGQALKKIPCSKSPGK